MSFRLYKEGQGTWARGTLAFVIGAFGVLSSVSLFETLSTRDWALGQWFAIPFFNFGVTPRVLLSVLVVIPFGLVALWLFNNARLSDFLIDTESELRNKVTWPTRREATNNSIVVVLTCIIMGVWVTLWDVGLRWLKDLFY